MLNFWSILGPPNITISHQTCVLDKSVKLIGNVFLYGNLPAIQTVFWTKNGQKLETEENGARFTHVSVDKSSLTIFEVNKYDAGCYQLTATNAIGSTKSDFLILGITTEKRKQGLLIHLNLILFSYFRNVGFFFKFAMLIYFDHIWNEKKKFEDWTFFFNF